MVAAGPATGCDLDDRRFHGPAQLVGERAAVHEDAGRQRRADLRQVPGDRGQRPLALADAAARQRAQEAERVRVLWVLEHRRRVALLDDLAGVHHADAVAQGADDAEVVGDEQDRGVHLGLQRADEVEHARLDRGVEPGRRLVEDEEPGVRRERDGDDDALLHPARQLVRIALGDRLGVGDLDPLERLERALLRLRLVLPEDREGLDDLRADLGRRVQGGARVLVDHRGVVGAEAGAAASSVIVVTSSPSDEDPAAGDDARCAAGSGPRRRPSSTCRSRTPRRGRTTRPGGPRTRRRAAPGAGCRARRRRARGPRRAAPRARRSAAGPGPPPGVGAVSVVIR